MTDIIEMEIIDDTASIDVDIAEEVIYSGYDEGYEAGQNSMIDPTKIIEKTASGIGSVTVDDVSEIPHEIKVQLSSDTITDFSGVTLKKYPNNLFTASLKSGSVDVNYGLWKETNTILRTMSGVYLTEGTYTLFTDTDKQFKVWIFDSTHKHQSTESLKTWQTNKVTFTISAPRLIQFEIQQNGNVIMPSDVKVLVLEKGETITEETIEVNADGTAECKSCSPNIIFAVDNEDITISATYHKNWSMQTEYDRFFDLYTYEDRRDKTQLFAFWEPEMFKPSKVIQFHNSSTNNNMKYLFASFGKLTAEGTEISLPKIFAKYGGGLNTHFTYAFNYMFANSNITDAGTIDLFFVGGTQYIQNLCDGCTRLKRIVLTNLERASLYFQNSFRNCISLEELFFENSTISQNLDVSYSPLCKDSILSIFTALSDTATNMSVTFNTNAVNTAFETSDGAADGSTSEEWLNLVATKPNWTISLA